MSVPGACDDGKFPPVRTFQMSETCAITVTQMDCTCRCTSRGPVPQGKKLGHGEALDNQRFRISCFQRLFLVKKSEEDGIGRTWEECIRSLRCTNMRAFSRLLCQALSTKMNKVGSVASASVWLFLNSRHHCKTRQLYPQPPSRWSRARLPR